MSVLWPMKNYLSTTDVAIWIALIVAQVILCLSALKRRLVGRLPWFSAYVFASTAESILLFGIAFFSSYTVYYHTFYVTGYATSALAFLTLIEFARQILPGLNLPKKEKAIACLLAALTSVGVFVAVWPMHSVANEKRIELGACLAIAVAFMFVAGYAHSLGLRWSRLLGGVSLTLGLVYLIDGAARVVLGHGHYPSTAISHVRQLKEIANVLAVIAWTVVVLSPWGEYEMTEEDLVKFQEIVEGIEDNFRRFARGGSR
jgi:hypothetical protein